MTTIKNDRRPEGEGWVKRGGAGSKNARLSTSGALATHDMWTSVVGHDPYASKSELESDKQGGAEINSEAKGLFQLARITGQTSGVTPGACKKCGMIGHLFFQCRNDMSFESSVPVQAFQSESEDSDLASTDDERRPKKRDSKEKKEKKDIKKEKKEKKKDKKEKKHKKSKK
jgi:hypothetical protein